MGRLLNWYMNRFALHDAGNARCARCPDHWPIEHKNCGGFLHAKSQTTDAGLTRLIVCDKCGHGGELLLSGNIGSEQFPAEAARQLERQTLDRLMSETHGSN